MSSEFGGVAQLTPVQKLKSEKSSHLDEFCVILTIKDLEDLNIYVKELIYNPQIAGMHIQKLLLLYVAAVKFVVLSFDDHLYLDGELVKNCNDLAKTLFMFYKDLNTILYAKQIEQLWKIYARLTETAKKIPVTSASKVRADRNRVLIELHYLGERLKGV